MAKARKRQVCLRIDEALVKEMEQTREKTGVPVSTQIELRIRGYAITSEREKGNPKGVWEWYLNSEKDEELANNVDMATERMRKELKLRR
jgi:hypothetical protein